MPSLRQLSWVVARDVNRTVGGGNAAMELLRRTFTAHGWFDDAAHGVIVAVSRLTPGTNILAYCTAAGWRMRGWRGSAVSLAAASVPSSIVILALIAVVTRALQYRIVQGMMAIGLLVACVLVFSSSWALLRPYVLGPRRWRALILSGAALALLFAGLTPVRILLLGALSGFLLPAGRSAVSGAASR